MRRSLLEFLIRDQKAKIGAEITTEIQFFIERCSRKTSKDRKKVERVLTQENSITLSLKYWCDAILDFNEFVSLTCTIDGPGADDDATAKAVRRSG